MTHDIIIPTVGESITSGIVSIWHKQTGDYVNAGEAVLTLETDKVSTEIAAEESGVIEILAEEGREVQVGEVVGRIEAGAVAPSQAEPHPQEPEGEEPESKEQEWSEEAPTEQVVEEEPVAEEVGGFGPAVRRLVAEEEVVTSEVDGTGKSGRITKEDVMSYLRQREEVAEAEEVGSESEPEPDHNPEQPTSDLTVTTRQSTSQAVSPYHGEVTAAVAMTTRRRMSPMRKKIAAQLVAVQKEAAILTTFNECDMSAVKSVRARMQESFQRRHGIKLGFMSFFVKATVNALKEVPSLNAQIDGDDIIENHYYDIGVAVGTERGLVVPVVRGADRKSFAEIERDLADYATKAREGRIKLEDMRGGVFTITNGGVYGSLMSTPILNPPQSGILGMHAIKDRPMAVDGEVVIRPMMYLAVSYDHRIVDGKDAVTFLVKLKEAIEDPMQLLL